MAVIVISGVDVNLVTDNLSTIVLFPSVLVESDDASAVLTATLTASDATNGGFTADSLLASGFTDLGDGTYTYSGTAAETTAALQLLVFEPATDSTASGSSAAIASARSVRLVILPSWTKASSGSPATVGRGVDRRAAIGCRAIGRRAIPRDDRVGPGIGSAGSAIGWDPVGLGIG